MIETEVMIATKDYTITLPENIQRCLRNSQRILQGYNTDRHINVFFSYFMILIGCGFVFYTIYRL